MTYDYPADTYYQVESRNNRTGNMFLTTIEYLSDGPHSIMDIYFSEVIFRGAPTVLLPSNGKIYIQASNNSFSYDVVMQDPNFDCQNTGCKIYLEGSKATNFLQMNENNGTLTLTRQTKERDIGSYDSTIRITDNIDGTSYVPVVIEVRKDYVANQLVSTV
eukprot:CAMPEP_0116872602 /NCGR_PEP_ID=MMETSP0463-20121206/3381_1 /TAXON_ID=181622 /ORGANISM="Strombidinopsis sp, Strain SopsisLIS2011" /LENGTH=160 /DNA_ID=CAMNT_0004513045 /DNA_START=267 /DNA_END=749 /DNA_ORIENTATION=+